MPYQDIPLFLQSYKDNSNKIIESLYRICLHMGGSITREDAFRLTHNDIKKINKILKEKYKNNKR